MTLRRFSIAAAIPWLLAAIALWVSLGALAEIAYQPLVTPQLVRAGLLPSLWWLAGLLVFAAVCLAIPALRRREAWLLGVPALVLLPWLPGRVPKVFLIWTGPLRTWIWLIVVVSLAWSWLQGGRNQTAFRAAADPRRAPWIAAAVAAAVYVLGAWLVFPHLPAGDEPHYLVISQSLLRDGDLKIENNHQRGDYREYFGGSLRPDYLRRGIDGEIYSIHPVGLPVIVAPIYAAGGYPAVLVFLGLLSAAATALTWMAVWTLTRDAAAAWFAWAAVSFSAPFFFQAFTVYPDAPGAALVMIGVLALCTDRQLSARRLALTGAALALLPWLHTRFAILEAVLAALLLARVVWSERSTRAALRGLALLAFPVLSALAWFGFFYAIYGTPSPAAPYNRYTQSEVGNLARGVPGLLFDQQFGLLPNAPVYICALLGFWTLFRQVPRVATSVAAVVVPYSLVAAMYAMWWAGYSSPARFLVPVSLALAIPLGVWYSALQSRSAKMLARGALVLSLLITATIAVVNRGALLFNVRDAPSRLLTWLSPAIDVTYGLPSLFRSEPPEAFFDAGVWLAAIALVAVAGRLVERRRIGSGALAALLGVIAVGVSSVALAVVWRADADALITTTRGTAAVLQRYDPEAGQIELRYSPLQRLPRTQLPQVMTLARARPDARRADEPMMWVPSLPAATYEISAYVSRPASGTISVTLDREYGQAWSWPVNVRSGFWRETVRIPVPVAVMLVDADAGARSSIQFMTLRAIDVPPARLRLAESEPWHVVRYGPAVAFLLGGHAYIEPGGVWIGGGEDAEFVLAPDPGTPLKLFVRNFAARNQVTLESGTWKQVLALEPRDERFVDVPSEPERAGVRLRVSSAAGARPADVEQSDDTRLLGVWLETR